MSVWAVAAAAMGVLAVWLLTAPGHRGAPTRRPTTSASGPSLRRGRRRGWRRRARRLPIGEVLVEVAARLRSGTDVESAWERALAGVAPVGGGPPAPRRLEPRPPATREPAANADGTFEGDPRAAGVPAPLADLLVRAGSGPDAAELAGAVAACRIAHRVGTPLADVLERCASGLVESAEAASARRTALAGPKSTARLLAWLPLAGIGLGTGLGADPLGVLLGGGIGGWCLVLGVGLLVAGRRWVAALVRHAERVGES